MTQNDIPVLNPNTADDEELRQLPGVGPQLAGRIVEGRPYQSAEDLRQVPGLGESVLENIKPFLMFEAQVSDRKQDRESDEKDRSEPVSKSRKPDQAAAEEKKYPLVLTESRSERKPESTAHSISVVTPPCRKRATN
jgi:competence ComEA-like helix-hairpin-helix protein